MANGISTDIGFNVDSIIENTKIIVNELLDNANLEKGQLLVVGCSSSEVDHHTIGTFSSKEIGEAIFKTINDIATNRGIYLATQCCEHLNRALIVEKEYAISHNLTIVNVVPQLKAGGSFSTAAYNGFNKPVAVEHIQADVGIDIGDTLIGMHLKDVAVPFRPSKDSIGDAHVVCATTRYKYIGGERASYM
ncbi:MAG: TIGR01440 family protein [Lachnospiraceae bacterium]|nr:TIGR01440 family protein [Lachnospiraceae bacterium]